MIGYDITAWDDAGWRHNGLSGWSEGHPILESWAEKLLAKQMVGTLAKLGGLSRPLTFIVSLIGDAIGTPIGNLIAVNLEKVAVARADQALDWALQENAEVGVQIIGDFELQYAVRTYHELTTHLLPVLCTIPATFSTEEEPHFMRLAVVRSTYLIHISYLRHVLHLLMSKKNRRKRFVLTINIDV